MNVGDNIRELRRRNGLTQEQLADRLGVAKDSVSRWERGVLAVRERHVEMMGALYGVTRDDIMSVDHGLAARLAIPEGARPAMGQSAVVPVLATAHMGELDTDEGAAWHVEVPAGVADRHPGAYAVHGFGACMNRRYPEDALLLVDPDMAPRNGDAVFVETPERTRIVRQWLAGGDTLLLVADSHDDGFSDVVFRRTDDAVTVLGVVVWYQAIEDVRRV